MFWEKVTFSCGFLTVAFPFGSLATLPEVMYMILRSLRMKKLLFLTFVSMMSRWTI